MFRDAAFRLASQAWNDYLEASPSNETHRINSNSKMDLELFLKKAGGGDEQVKMIEELDEESIESSLGSSPPTESTLGSRKLNDSNGKSNAVSTPSGSMSNLPEKWDNSEDSPAVEESDKKKKRKSIAVSKKGRTESTSGANGKEMDDSEENSRHRADTSPPVPRHSKNSSDTGTKTRNVGFDLRMPQANRNGEVSSEKLADADVPSSAVDSLSGAGTSSKEGGSSKEQGGHSPSPPPDGNSGESGAGNSGAGNGGGNGGGGGGGGSLPEIPVNIPTQASCKHVVEEADDKKFSGTKLGTKVYKGVTLKEFFALVFCNGDYNKELIAHFDYTEWNAPTWAMSDESCCASRLLQYRMHLNASIGPKSTRQDSHQNARFKNDTTLLIESCNISKDVPMSDAFEVHEKWVVTQEGKDVKVELTAGVVWKKSAWGLKGTINQKSIEGVETNWEYVQKLIETTVNKYTSGGGGGGGASAASSPSSQPKAKKKVDDEESSSDDEDKKPRRKRKSSRKIGKDAGVDTSDHPAAAGGGGGSSDMFAGWKGIALVAVAILLIMTFGYFAYNVSSISSRLQTMEASRHWGSPINHEEMNLRERVAFLEHLTTALLRNVSDPGSYKTDQLRYFTALRDMDAFLGKAKESVGTLQHSVHRLHEQKGEPLTTAQLVEALKTLPIDRKVLGYLTNPESFAQQLASVLEHEPNAAAAYTYAAASNDSYGWYFYFFIASLLIAVAAAGAAKALGVF